MAKEGAKIIINYNTNDAEANKTKDPIITLGGDASKPAKATTLFKKAIATYGHVAISINNAGIMDNKRLEVSSQTYFSKVFDFIVKRVFNILLQASAKLADKGIILNFSSSTTRMILPTYGHLFC